MPKKFCKDLKQKLHQVNIDYEYFNKNFIKIVNKSDDLFLDSGSDASLQTLHVIGESVKQLTLGIPSDEPVPRNISFPWLGSVKLFINY